MKSSKILLSVIVVVALGAGYFAISQNLGEKATAPNSASVSPESEGTQSVPDLEIEEILAGDGNRAAVEPPVFAPNPVLQNRSRPLKEDLRDLMALAESDISTAFQLGSALSVCASMPINDQVVERLLDEGGAAVQAAQGVVDTQDYCAGLEEGDFRSALEMLDRAASAGLPKAQIEYVDAAGAILYERPEYRMDGRRLEEFKRKSLNYLGAAARSGHHEALARMAMLYADGRVVNADPTVAAQLYREFLNRSGQNSEAHLRVMEMLDQQARDHGAR